MKTISILRQIKHTINSRQSIKKAYRYDCKEYSKWQYHNPNVKTKNALEAKILRQTHIIEKGLSLSHPREKFGVQKALELLDSIEEFTSFGYKIEESTPVINALGVINAYLQFHRTHGYNPKQVSNIFVHYEKYLNLSIDKYGVIKTSKNAILKQANGQFPKFFISRHSVRQFAATTIDEEDICKAVRLAMHAPSACNRQSCRVYFYKDRKINAKLGELIAGNTGFDSETKNYLVVTSDMSAFYDAFERNQIYVDGGIFALALTEALHYYGIASCILQNGEYKEKNAKFKEICGNIPDNEKIILFIAIGYYKEEFAYASSHRKNLNEVLKIK